MDDVPEEVADALPLHRMEFVRDDDKHRHYVCSDCGLTAYHDPISGFVGGPARVGVCES
jgi:hypothetical protein